jgi:hypothetical protein
MKTPIPSFLAVLALLLATPLLRLSAQQQDNYLPVQATPQAGPLDVQMRTDTGRDVHLRLDEQYTTQDLGNRLTTEQIEKLDTIRAEAPSKYQILSALFPRQIAEFLLRTPSSKSTPPADDAVQRLVWEIASSYLSQPDNPSFTDSQRHARADFIRASLASLPAQPPAIQRILEAASQYQDPDFTSPDKTSTFLVLKNWYSPYRPASMSIIGDILRIDGSTITEHLSADAAAAGQLPEQYAASCYSRYSRALQRWRTGQLTGDAYAGTIRTFLNDPRLADFTPVEVSRAYQRVFARDLKTDLEADRVAARLGHPVTYLQLHGQVARE